MTLSKQDLVAKLLTRLSETSENTALARANARQASIDAPGAMVSRYDSSKEEQGYLADALGLRSIEIGHSTNKLRSLSNKRR